MKDCDLETAFLEGPNGPLFCLTFLPASRQKQCTQVIIHVPPFAEEMNKSRPMVSAQAKLMATMGYPVVLFDLFGTGDSSGQFEEASWESWIRDLQFVCEWAQANFSVDKLILWGLRAGCLLATACVQRDTHKVSRLIFWQPVVSGERVLTQFRRLDQLSLSVKPPGLGDSTAVPEIAGYRLNSELIAELSQADLGSCRIPPGVHLDWLEVTALEGLKLGHASEQALQTLREPPHPTICTGVVRGDPFWFTQEVSMVPALLEETLRLLGSPDREELSVDN